jgi:chromosome segregation ATPase
LLTLHQATHAKELSNKGTKISALEATVKELQSIKASQFETIQARQAESEAARSEMEGLQGRTKELEFQLREAEERIALLEDAPRSPAPDAAAAHAPRETGTSAAEVQRLLADADSRAETKLSELRFRVRALERERNELEEDWASKLGQRVKELEALRQTIADKEAEVTTSAAARRERDARIDAQDAERRDLERQMVELRAAVDEAHADVAVALEAEKAARDELAAAHAATTGVQTQLDESKALHAQLRQNNKTLRDELRKVQSSAQLLERQRNPGVGYWASGTNPTNPASPSAPPSASPASVSSPPPALAPTPAAPDAAASPSPAPSNEEEVNLEYLRNVILQFLEHKEMRPNLVRVLSVILRFTPQELRRLNAKLGT